MAKASPLTEARRKLGRPAFPEPRPVTFYGTMTCNRCHNLALIVLAVGADGYRLDRVESNCAHLPSKAASE